MRTPWSADERTAEKLVGTCKSELATHPRETERTSRRPRGRALRTSARWPPRRRRRLPEPKPTVEPPQPGGRRRRFGPVVAAHPERGYQQRRQRPRDVPAHDDRVRRLRQRRRRRAGTTVSSSTPRARGRAAGTRSRSSSITDGAAQIKATALALRQGYGHAWWDPSYTWAFQGELSCAGPGEGRADGAPLTPKREPRFSDP